MAISENVALITIWWTIFVKVSLFLCTSNFLYCPQDSHRWNMSSVHDEEISWNHKVWVLWFSIIFQGKNYIYGCVLLDCPKGTWSDNCSKPCPRLRFGRKCLQTCSCDENMCDAVTGCNDSSEFCKIVYTCTNDTIYNSVVVNNNDFFLSVITHNSLSTRNAHYKNAQTTGT